MFMNLMETGEREKCDRMMSAMMGMVKMNIAELQAAYDGTAQPKEEATKKYDSPFSFSLFEFAQHVNTNFRQATTRRR